MSDLLRSTLRRSRLGSPSRDPFELTESDRELQPFIAEEEQKRERRAALLQPLEWIFDRLQTGQYISANLAREVAEHFTGQDDTSLQEIGQAIWQGITGERKGSYEDVLRETLGVGMQKLFPDAPEGKRRAQWDWADVFGFIGDVALDPLTYVNPFGVISPKLGATKVAQSAAMQYADDAVRVTLKRLGMTFGPDDAGDLARFAQKTFDPTEFSRIARESQEKAIQYFNKRAKKDIRRELNRIYTDAYESALLEPVDVLRDRMRGSIEDIVPAERGLVPYDEAFAAVPRPGYDDTLQSILGRVDTSYVGAGERKLGTVFGKEFGTNLLRNIQGEGAGPVARTYASVKRRIKDTGIYKTFSNAWSWYMENSIVGRIRRELGFRNPYEKAIRIKELNLPDSAFREKYARQVKHATESLDERQQDIWVQLNAIAERQSTPEAVVTPFDLIQRADIQEQLNMKDTDVHELGKWGRSVFEMTRQWRTELQEAVNEGILEDFGDIVNYLPVQVRKVQAEGVGTGTSFMRRRELGLGRNIDAQTTMFQNVFGVDERTARSMVEGMDLSDIHTNLENMLYIRSAAQAKVMRRVNMVRQFKEFGVPISGMHQISAAGLVESSEPALKGYLFDQEVAGAINRAVNMTAPDTVTAFGRIVKRYMNWWKGVVTMTPGFHARNALSNQITGFMKHGARWVNPDIDKDALAAVLYRKWGEAVPDTVFTKLGMDEWAYTRVLKKRYGDKTLRELAQEEGEAGLISEAIRGFSAESVIDDLSGKTTWNPANMRFKGFKWSHDIGYVVENHSKIKSFLLDYSDIMGRNIDLDDTAALSKQAQNWARMEAKKWWIDYEDLTDFERKLKNYFPFFTWLRRNIPNQIAAITTFPEIYSMFPKIQEFAQFDAPEFDPKLIPDWMKQEAMFPIGRTEEGFLKMFRPDFPMADLNLLPLLFGEGVFAPQLSMQEAKQDVVSMTSPLVQAAASAMTEKGYDFFYREELTDRRKAPFLLRLFVSKPRAMEAVDGFLRFLGKEEGLDAQIDDEGKLRIPPKLAINLQRFLPIIRTMDFMFYSGFEFGDRLNIGLEKAVEAFTGAQDEYEGIEQAFQVLSFWTGIKVYPEDTKEAQRRYGRDVYYDAMQARTEARRGTPEFERRSLDRMQATDRRIRRLGL